MSALVLVPSSLRATRASRLLCDAEGGVLFGPRVTTLPQLATALLAGAGDPRAVLSPLAERLLAVEAAREAGFASGPLAISGGAARLVAAALRELRAAEVTPSALEEASREVAGRGAERLAGCGRMLRAYESRLEELRALDGAGALRAAAAALQQRGGFGEVRGLDLLVLEGFAALSAAEWSLVSALATIARRTHARLPYFPERPDLSGAEPLLRRLEALGAAQGGVEVRLEHLEGDRAGAIASALLTVAGGPGGAVRDAAGELFAEAGAGEEGEAAVAAGIAARWIDAGIAPGEIAVFAPSQAAAGRLSRAFVERGIPMARGAGEPLGDSPAIRAVRLALAAGTKGLDRSAAEELLSSTYVSGAPPPARLRDILDRAGALDGRCDAEDALRRRAAALGWAARERAALLAAADAFADLKRRIAPLGGEGRPREHAARLRAFVDGGVRRRAARGEPKLVRRDLSALKRLEDCADSVVTALAMVGRGSAPVSAAEWMELLDVAIDGAAIPAADPAAGAAELWPLADAPGVAARAAIVTGCARGAFPAPPRPGLLRDAERSAVNARLGRAALQPSGGERATALHAAFCALAAGREAVALTWPAPAGGRAGGTPAPLASELLAAAGRRLEVTPRPPAPLADAATAQEALDAAARLVRSGADAEVRAALAAAPDLAARLDEAADRAEVERERQSSAAARAASPHAGAVAPGPLLDQALPAEWTPSQLEVDARCPFRFFLETPCRLVPPDEALLDVSPRDEGRLLHLVLERYVRARLRAGARPFQDDERARAELRAAAEQVFRELEPSGALGDPGLWPARRELVLNRLERVLASEAAVAAADGLQPVVLEHAFGGEGGAPPLVFADGGREVRLRGRVDRIDASPERLRVLDWKNGRASSGSNDKLAPEAFGVTSFQLPAYLMAARRALPGRARLEAAFAFLRSARRSEPFECAADDPLLSTDEAERRALRERGARAFADAVLDAVTRMREGRFPVAPRDCGGCPFGAVCRAEGSEEDE